MSEQLKWWQAGVIYQIYPRSYQDSTGNGIGDLPGMIQRLDHLAELGVTGVWISPCFTSPMEDFGYDVADYCDIDPLFGTLDDFDRLVAEAKQRDLKIILDYVPNHTSHQHPWFIESRQRQDSAKRDWYTWRPAKADGSPPNNWRSITEQERLGSAWAWDEQTGEYFLATFSPTQPDLNWDNLEVRTEMLNVLKFWLDRGVDGFRMDMIHFVGKDSDLRDEADDVADDDYVNGIQYHIDWAKADEYVSQMYQTVQEYPDKVTIGEVGYRMTLERLQQSYQMMSLPFNFRLTYLPFEADSLRRFIDSYDESVQGHGWPNYCFGNHDRPRMSLHGERTRLAVMLLLTLRGTPFIYYGDEIGQPNVDVPPELQQDPWIPYDVGISRDVARTPMQWDSSPNAGFSTSTDPLWLPISDDYTTMNVAMQKDDPASMLTLHRQLIALRCAQPALHQGSYQSLDAPNGCLLYQREAEGQTMLIALNFADREQEVSLPEGTWSIQLSTQLDRTDVVDGALRLRPFEGVVSSGQPT